MAKNGKSVTDLTIKNLKPAEPGKRYEVRDTAVTGLRIRVTEHRTKTFLLLAQFPGQKLPTRRELGRYGEMTLEEARDLARAWRKLIKEGKDPRAEQERVVHERRRKNESTFAKVAEAFITEKLSTERRGAEVERNIRKEFLPLWGARPIDEITADDVLKVVRAAKQRGAPYQAHNLLTDARRLFGWAIAQRQYGLGPHSNPCDGLKPKAIIGERKARQRVLDDDELLAFWRATKQMPYPWGPMYRMLLLTGQRKSEISDARWPEIDLDRKLLMVPPERFKSDATHLVPLTDAVVSLLEELPRFKRGDHLFSTTFGAIPVDGFSRSKSRLDELMLRWLKAMARRRGDDPAAVQLEPFVIHDLRRTVRTRLSSLRVSDAVAEMIIGHGRKGLQRVYDQHKFLDEMREALELWTTRLRDIVTTAPENVVALKRSTKTRGK
jgi:integrase